MKGKLALLALLSTVVTVGGVYATWTFAEGNTSAANTTTAVQMTGVNASTSKGTLSVMASSYKAFIDDSDNNHLPDLKTEGDVIITFTPSASASAEILANGIDVKFVISYVANTGGPATLEDWTYDGTQIFDIVYDASNPFHLDKEAAVNNDGVFTWTINHANVGIALHVDFDDKLIDTLDEYNALSAELTKGHFQLTVEECLD